VPLWTPEHTPPRSSSPSTALHASCPQPTPGHQPTVSAHSPLALLVLPLRPSHLFLHRARPSAIQKKAPLTSSSTKPPVRLVSSCVSSALPRRREICRTACPSPPRRTGNQTVCTSSAFKVDAICCCQVFHSPVLWLCALLGPLPFPRFGH
jgi:hypothetical protein